MKTNQIIDSIIHEMGQIVFAVKAAKINKDTAIFTITKLAFIGQTIASGSRPLTHLINTTKADMLQKIELL